MATIPGYYTIDEAAEVIGVSRSQVSRYISAGHLQALDLGHQKLIEQQEVHRFERIPVGNPKFREQRKKAADS